MKDPYFYGVGDFRVPDAIGSIVGWRTWRLLMPQPRNGLLLQSVHTPTFWFPESVHEAECLVERSLHPAPSGDCTCGFYSLKNTDFIDDPYTNVAGMNYSHMEIMGEVEIWGRIIEGEIGYRSQFAKIKSFSVSAGGYAVYAPHLEKYNVPIGVYERRERFANLVEYPWRSYYTSWEEYNGDRRDNPGVHY